MSARVIRVAPCVIVGAGAAGLMAAAHSRRGTVALERMAGPGRKLLATGGGRCNFTRMADLRELRESFGAGKMRFVSHALAQFPPQRIIEFFGRRGVAHTVEDGVSVFPRSGRASDVLEALLGAARDAGAEVMCGAEAGKVLLRESRVCGVELRNGDVIETGKVILAGGGRSMPKLGSDGSCAEIARALGIGVAELRPALGGVLLGDAWARALSGVSLGDACITLVRRTDGGKALRRVWRGEMLFTHRGVSGPAALNASGEIGAALADGAEFSASLAMIAGMTAEKWLAQFSRWHGEPGGRMLRNRMAELLPRSVAEAAVAECGICGDVQCAKLGRDDAARLARFLGECGLSVRGVGGFGESMVTRGGVALGEVDAKTLESRKIPGLFFAGEVLDVDGPCGGYNLTWAFASGFLAGRDYA